MAAKIHVESISDFVCIFDDFLINFGFARTRKTLNSIGRADKTSVVDFFGLGVVFDNFSHQKRLISGTFWIQKQAKNMMENKAAFFYALGAPSGCLWDLFGPRGDLTLGRGRNE